MNDRKIETAKSVLALFEKEWSRLEVPKTSSVTMHSTPPRQQVQDYVLGNSPSKRADKRRATEEADPDAPRKRSYVGRRVAKYFDKQLYFGTISSWDPAAIVDEKIDLWKVDYDDDDSEDMEEWEVHSSLELYAQARERELE